MKTTNIMIVGVGGQGSLLASKLLGRLLLDEGYDVKVSEVHGMSQRGGSVVTYVRFGERVYSPVIAEGEADFIVSFEKLEAARWAACLAPTGRIIVNTQEIDPMPVLIGNATYPGEVLSELVAKGRSGGCCGCAFPCPCRRQRQGREHCIDGKACQISADPRGKMACRH